ncbi:DUF2000 domain-containing protein [Dactylosporangium sp. NPDC049140]|uniref:DUF2000 domain-containing protein n=1 Tax=Dactylosporangium sp. NPDC049140 TaxID=3155647 RepID=UPI0033DE4B88
MTSRTPSPDRIVVVVRDDLPAWRAVNAAAVLSLTLGTRLSEVTGPGITTADGVDLGPLSRHAMPVLVTGRQAIDALHAAALQDPDAVVVALDEAMLSTNSYDQYAEAIRGKPAAAFACFALVVAGTKSAVRRFTRGLTLYGA